jgi:serine/threonine protein kinase
VGARTEQLKGVRFGAYEIVRLVGHGATASVFEASHVGLDKPVAIKILHEHLASDAQIAGRFLREGRVAARLRHPNIVSVLDVGADHGVPYLVMELLTGSDLRSLLADVRVLSVEHALTFLLPITSGLAHAHEAGVIHRDLKPANIFLAREAREEVVPKLVDFGLSKLVHAGGEISSALTAAELVAGTALYMAPEQTLAMKNATAASDQYSLAAIVYESVTGEPPFEGDGVYALLEQIRSARVRPPSAVNPKLDPSLDAVLLRAMSRDAQDRWPSMRALGKALLPYASEAVARLLERDFADRSLGSSAAASLPSIRQVVPLTTPDALTRVERSEEQVISDIHRTTPLPCPPGTSPFHIKGVMYRGFFHHVSRTVGLDALAENLDDEGLRAFVRQPFLATARYDVLPYFPLFAALARMTGVPLETLARMSSGAQARYDAKTAYKMILRTDHPEDIVDRINRFNAQIYDFGSYLATQDEKNQVRLVFAEIPAYIEPWFAPMHVAYAEEILRLAGARELVTVPGPHEDAGTRAGFPLRSYRTEFRWR